jgi:GGDEF domain-containing protein
MNLSLNSWIKQLDSTDSYLECALNCYKSAIASIRVNLVASDPSLKRQISGRLDRLASIISRKNGVETLASTAARLDEILTEHRAGEEAVYQEEQMQLRRTLAALEGLVKTISARACEESQQLNEVLHSLEGALFEGDLATTHRILQDQIRKLRTCLLTISEDRQSAESALQTNLASLREQTCNPREQQPIATGDDGGPAVSALHAALNTYMTTYTLFSLVLLKVDDMADLANQWLPEAREQLLASVQSRLAENAGPFDRTHSWTDGEFVVIMRSTLARAMEEASRLKIVLSAPYQVETSEGLAQIKPTISAGAVEYVPGEDVISLMGRAELAAIRDREPLLAGEGPSCEPQAAA